MNVCVACTYLYVHVPKHPSIIYKTSILHLKDAEVYVRNFNIAKYGPYACHVLVCGYEKQIWGTEAGYKQRYIRCERQSGANNNNKNNNPWRLHKKCPTFQPHLSSTNKYGLRLYMKALTLTLTALFLAYFSSQWSKAPEICLNLHRKAVSSIFQKWNISYFSTRKAFPWQNPKKRCTSNPLL